MAKKNLTEKEKKEIKLLQSSYAMYSKTLKEAAIKGKENTNEYKRIQDEQRGVKERILNIDENAELKTEQQVKTESMMNFEGMDDDIFKILKSDADLDVSVPDAVDEYATPSPLADTEAVSDTANDEEDELLDTSVVDEPLCEVINESEKYDIINLPSGGEPYPSKRKNIAVGFLTAYDENLITSPNLYKNGMIIDYLLKHKVVDKNFNVDDLVSGDADAITVWLRATSYGVEYPIYVTDPETKEQFKTTIDLSDIKVLDFNLKADEKGWFEFTLPRTKKKVKFVYLTRKQEKNLVLATQLESFGTKAQLLENTEGVLKTALYNDNILQPSEKMEMSKAVKTIERWVSRLKKKDDTPYSRIITNTMRMQIKSIDGETDTAKIYKEIDNIPASDSLALRKYINDNKPGMDFNITVKRPENLGGGSFKTFLEWDDTVFINIPSI